MSNGEKPRVHVVARDNGAGLSRDITILKEAIAAGGFDLTVSALGQGGLRRGARSARLRARLAWEAFRRSGPSRYDVNLMDERIWPNFRALARHNVLMPHPEWFDVRCIPQLGMIDRVFAKTRHAVPIFEAQGKETVFVGFSSLDRRLADVAREPTFLHVGGRSVNKGSQPLIDLWLRRPDFPLLTMIQRAPLERPDVLPANIRLITDYIEDAELRAMQNRHLFHLCPSETEGFGHHLVEGLSCGAITLATDAPPMNEMITRERGELVPYSRTGTQQLATTYFVEVDALEAGVERLLALDERERATKSAAARAWWDDNDRGFRERLAAAIEAVSSR
ncbi:MAG TPA: glycosyltransferase [Rhodanobacteraceae bacterium]|nr:glycosyltransferase [Rhodanobacteraceae bacterium]